jgi:pyruvate dehydrogenase complex dehydrogenase (E1) component
VTPEREAEIRLYVERLKQGSSFGFSGAAIEELLAEMEVLRAAFKVNLEVWAVAEIDRIKTLYGKSERLKAL